MATQRFWARFEDQLIGLDVAHDTYTVFSPEQSDALLCQLANAALEPSQARRAVHGAAPAGAVAPAPATSAPPRAGSPASLLQSARSYAGVTSDCWSLREQDISFRGGWRSLLRAMGTLHRVHRIAQRRRLAGLRACIEHVAPRRSLAAGADLDQIASTMNAACLLYPKRTKCLEWAAAVTVVGRAGGHDARLVIGVQNRPFYAHAWVEGAGQVIADDPALRAKLAVILELP